jgi:hypothetical protein
MDELDDLIPEPDEKGGVDMSEQGWCVQRPNSGQRVLPS